MSKDITPSSSEKRLSVLSRTAKEVRNYRVRMKLLAVLLAVLTTFVGIVYIASVLYEQTGSFTISINKYENLLT